MSPKKIKIVNKTQAKRINVVNANPPKRISPEEFAAAIGGKMLCPPCGRLLEKKLMTGVATLHETCSFAGCGCACHDEEKS